MTDVFISYSSKDRDKVVALAAALEHHGLVVWWDRHLVVGERYQDKIDEHVTNARVIVTLVTPNALEERPGKTNWVRSETLVGVHNKNLVPVRYASGVQGFDEIRDLHMENLGDWTGRRDATQILGLVRRINDIKSRRDLADFLKLIPLGIGDKLKHSGLIKTLFNANLHGLHLRTLLLGAMLSALPTWGALLVTAPDGVSIGPGAYILIAGLFVVSRCLDHVVVVTKGGGAGRFFSPSFSFSILACALVSLILTTGNALYGNLSADIPLEIGRLVAYTVCLTLGMLILSYCARALLAFGQVLHRRL